MFHKIKADFKANYSTRSKLVCLNYRIGNYAYEKNNLILKIFYRYFNIFTRIVTHSDISPKCTIGMGLALGHGGLGTVIHSSANIGSNVVISHQVTIGVKDGSGSPAASIGDNADIGVGAKIIGAIMIGDNVKIGANAVVVSDIPNNVTAVGIPAIIKKKTV